MPYSNTYWMCCLCWIYWPLSSSVVTTFWKFDGWLQATCIAVDVWAMCVKILEARQFSSILSMLSLMICFSGSKVLDCRYSLFPAMSPVRVLTRDIFGELSPGVFFKFAKSPVLMSYEIFKLWLLFLFKALTAQRSLCPTVLWAPPLALATVRCIERSPLGFFVWFWFIKLGFLGTLYP